MTERHEFLSDAWFAALEQEAQKLLDASAAGQEASFVYAEHFTDIPAPGDDGHEAGYVMTLSRGKAHVRPGIQGCEAADCLVRMDYGAALESLKFKSGPALGEFMRKAGEAGAVGLTGSLEGAPIAMNALHDAICDRTRK